MSSRLTRILQDLRAALFESESESTDSVLADIREAGLSVYLVLHDPGSGEDPEALRLVHEVSEDDGQRQDFRIGQADLTILRGLGIDPTRTLRRGRGARRK